LLFTKPETFTCDTYHESPSKIYACESKFVEVNLFEMLKVSFYLTPSGPVIRTDFILISSHQLGPVTIIPSRTDLDFSTELGCYEAQALVKNTSNMCYIGIIRGKYELINEYKAIEFDKKYRSCLVTALRRFPLGREILYSEEVPCHPLPIFTINQVSKNIGEDIKVSDIDVADTVMAQEPTYSGEGKIDEEIIEPQGRDLPTVIFKNAEEAIDLSSQKPEFREHLKSIFLQKYPQAVALHAMDSGNFSLTLGYVRLRLREGETLPRNKRIFHISPSDQRHLDDICDFLIKYGYIRGPQFPLMDATYMASVHI
jgi:hypothetical protein